MKSNLRSFVPNELERKIASDAKAKGISKSEWVAMACADHFKRKPEGKAAPLGLDDFLRDLEAYLLRMKGQHSGEIDAAIRRVRAARRELA